MLWPRFMLSLARIWFKLALTPSAKSTHFWGELQCFRMRLFPRWTCETPSSLDTWNTGSAKRYKNVGFVSWYFEGFATGLSKRGGKKLLSLQLLQLRGLEKCYLKLTLGLMIHNLQELVSQVGSRLWMSLIFCAKLCTWNTCRFHSKRALCVRCASF